MDDGMREAVIGIGTNLADRARQIAAARAALLATPGIETVELGPVLETEPVLSANVVEPHPRYLNTVAVAKVGLTAEVLMARLLAVEAAFGRRRSGEESPRTLDLDLLLLGRTRCQLPGLTLPHPRMWDRAFVREPFLKSEGGVRGGRQPPLPLN